jgi:hypothetical protein
MFIMDFLFLCSMYIWYLITDLRSKERNRNCKKDEIYQILIPKIKIIFGKIYTSILNILGQSVKIVSNSLNVSIYTDFMTALLGKSPDSAHDA